MARTPASVPGPISVAEVTRQLIAAGFTPARTVTGWTLAERSPIFPGFTLTGDGPDHLTLTYVGAVSYRDRTHRIADMGAHLHALGYTVHRITDPADGDVDTVRISRAASGSAR
jgi:hypothetical protein